MAMRPAAGCCGPAANGTANYSVRCSPLLVSPQSLLLPVAQPSSVEVQPGRKGAGGGGYCRLPS